MKTKKNSKPSVAPKAERPEAEIANERIWLAKRLTHVAFQLAAKREIMKRLPAMKETISEICPGEVNLDLDEIWKV